MGPVRAGGSSHSLTVIAVGMVAVALFGLAAGFIAGIVAARTARELDDEAWPIVSQSLTVSRPREGQVTVPPLYATGTWCHHTMSGARL